MDCHMLVRSLNYFFFGIIIEVYLLKGQSLSFWTLTAKDYWTKNLDKSEAENRYAEPLSESD